MPSFEVLTDTPLKPHSQGKAKIPNSLLAIEHHDASERKKTTSFVRGSVRFCFCFLIVLKIVIKFSDWGVAKR